MILTVFIPCFFVYWWLSVQRFTNQCRSFVPETWEHFLFQSNFVTVQSSFHSLCFSVEYLVVSDSSFGGVGWFVPTIDSRCGYLLSAGTDVLLYFLLFLLYPDDTYFISVILFLAFFILVFAKKVYRNIGYKYRCGRLRGETKRERYMPPLWSD